MQCKDNLKIIFEGRISMFVLNSELIKEKMESKNYNQTTFADSLGMTSQNFSYMLSNKSKSINLEVAYRICQLLNLKIDDIIIDHKQSQTPTNLIKEMHYLIDKLNKLSKIHIEETEINYIHPNQLTIDNLDSLDMVAESSSSYDCNNKLDDDYILNEFEKLDDSDKALIRKIINHTQQLTKKHNLSKEESDRYLETFIQWSLNNIKTSQNNKPATVIFDKSTENYKKKK